MKAAGAIDFGFLGYSVACALLVAGGAFVFHEQMGTNHLSIHIVSVFCAALLAVLWRLSRRKSYCQLIGLQRPKYTCWIWILPSFGILTGFLRFQLYRQWGLGGVSLYERELVPALQGDSVPETLVRGFVLMAGSYAAVFIPGLLFLGVIQQLFARVGLFLVGLLLQAAAFGFVHAYMGVSFDLVYGAEALLGAVVSGIAFERSKNLFVPALFMSASVVTSTILLALRPASFGH